MLLEVVVALALFVAAAAVLTGGIHASLRSVERLRLGTHAANLAVTVLSELQMGLRSTDTAGPQPFAEPFENWTCELQTAPVESEIGEASTLTKVEVIIRHKEESVVYRLTQIVRLGRAAQGKEEPSVSASL
ncbi:MAG: hypothetical protein NTW03_22045 [Verrucomicrobia bacterium]|nr:hypothetical protein [Verrucomicrobiota bacterium]